MERERQSFIFGDAEVEGAVKEEDQVTASGIFDEMAEFASMPLINPMRRHTRKSLTRPHGLKHFTRLSLWLPLCRRTLTIHLK